MKFCHGLRKWWFISTITRKWSLRHRFFGSKYWFYTQRYSHSLLSALSMTHRLWVLVFFRCGDISENLSKKLQKRNATVKYSLLYTLPDLSLITSLSFSNLSLYITGILLSLRKLFIDSSEKNFGKILEKFAKYDAWMKFSITKILCLQNGWNQTWLRDLLEIAAVLKLNYCNNSTISGYFGIILGFVPVVLTFLFAEKIRFTKLSENFSK